MATFYVRELDVRDKRNLNRQLKIPVRKLETNRWPECRGDCDTRIVELRDKTQSAYGAAC